MKGFLFSVMSILLLLPFMLVVSMYPERVLNSEKVNIEQLLFDQINYFEGNIESDLNRILAISGKRAFIALTNNVIISGVPVNSTSDILTELMRYGTFFGDTEPLMEENNVNYWYERIRSDGSLVGYSVSLDDLGVSSYLSSEKEVVFEIYSQINVSDFSGNYRIVRSSRHSLEVSVEQFEDPLYPLNTYGLVKRAFKMCDFVPKARQVANGTSSSGSAKGFAWIAESSDDLSSVPDKSQKILVIDYSNNSQVNLFKGVVIEDTNSTGVSVPYIAGAANATETIAHSAEIFVDSQSMKAWYLGDLEMMISEHCYYPSEDGPNIFDRCEGKASSSSFPIESFVDIVEISSNGLSVRHGQSVVDKHYFSENIVAGYPVRGIEESWFKLDNESASFYNVDELI